MALKTQDYWKLEYLIEAMKDIIGDGQFSENNFHTPDSFKRYLNLAMFTVASRLPPEALDELFACDRFTPTSTTYNFIPSNDYLTIWFVRWRKDSSWTALEVIERAPPEWADAAAINAHLASSTLFAGKHKYIEFNSKVWILPVIDDPDGLVEVYYIKNPTRLEQNTQYPQLSDEAVGLLILEASQYAAVKENDWDKVKFLQAKANEGYAAILSRYRGEEQQRTAPAYGGQ